MEDLHPVNHYLPIENVLNKENTGSTRVVHIKTVCPFPCIKCLPQILSAALQDDCN